jgi:hypothetical protein
MEKTWDEIRDSYRMAAVHFANRYNKEVSEHIIDVMISVMMTRDNVLQGGSFVQAIVGNNLREAISRADDDCSNNLKIITICCHNCYVETELLYE